MTSMIAFGEGSEAHYSIYRAVAEREYMVDIKLTPEPAEGAGPPHEQVIVVTADDEGIEVCETRDGTPLRNTIWRIRYDQIDTLTII